MYDWYVYSNEEGIVFARDIPYFIEKAYNPLTTDFLGVKVVADDIQEAAKYYESLENVFVVNEPKETLMLSRKHKILSDLRISVAKMQLVNSAEQVHRALCIMSYNIAQSSAGKKLNLNQEKIYDELRRTIITTLENQKFSTFGTGIDDQEPDEDGFEHLPG
jgi:hypothetical protein